MLMFGDYKVLQELKQGAQGLVCVVENVKTKTQHALKSLPVNVSKKGEFEKGIEMWKVLRGSLARDSFVAYEEHFYEGNKALLVMEYCINGDLETLIKKKMSKNERFSEEDVMEVLIEVTDGLKEMHSHNFIHRDIKTANILIDPDGRFKLCDFNSFKIFEEGGGTQTMVGTLEYTSPEIVNSEQYNCSVDIFSFGCVLYQMMVGKTPFVNDRGVVMKNLMVGKYDAINPLLGYSKPLVDLVHACLSVDPSHRPSAAEIVTMPFVIQARILLRLTRAEREVAKLRKDMLSVENNKRLLGLVYPVGSIYMSVVAADPATLLGFGTWVSWGAGRVPVGVDTSDGDFNVAEKTDGRKTVNLQHRHQEGDLRACVGSWAWNGQRLAFQGTSAINPNTGVACPDPLNWWIEGTCCGNDGGMAHYTKVVGYTNDKLGSAESVMNPYITCYMWKRTA